MRFKDASTDGYGYAMRPGDADCTINLTNSVIDGFDVSASGAIRLTNGTINVYNTTAINNCLIMNIFTL